MRDTPRPLIPTLAAASVALALILIALSLTTHHLEAVASLLFFLTLVVASASLIAMVSQHRPSAKPTPSFISVVNCLKCEFREEREFKEGDFVYKRLEKCSKCGGELFISAIYAVKRATES